MRIGAAMIAVLALLAAAASGAETLEGSGHGATVRRDATGFHALAVSVPAQVELVQGTEEGARLTADDNVLPALSTVVEDGVLRIRFPRHLRVRPRTPIVIRVETPRMDRIVLVGRVRLTAAKLEADRLAADLDGSAMITLPDVRARTLLMRASGHCHGMAAGRVERFELNLAGEGEINAARLQAAEASIGITGAAQVATWVHDRLQARITGTGAVRYFGDPVVEKSVIGRGVVERLGAAPP